MDRILFSGVISALATPMREDGSLREDTVRRLIRWQLDAGMAGFYVCGATGEGVIMHPLARKRLTEIAVEETRGRGVVIAHVGAVDLETAVDLAAHAAKSGVHAVASVPPFFYAYGMPEMKSYYTALTEASGLPTLMYASPLAGTAFSYDMVAEIMTIPGVIGLKWTNPNYYQMSRLKQIDDGNINVLNGPDETLLCGLCMGADGGIGGTYNVMPKLFAEIYRNFQAGRLAEARAAQSKANKVIDLLLDVGVLPAIKEVLGWIGYDMGYCIPPLKRLGDGERTALIDKLNALRFQEDYL